MDAISTTVRDPGNKNFDAFALVLMSHGSRGVVYGSDNQQVDLENILHIMDASRCPALRGKPKIIIIQACQKGRSSSQGIICES